MSWTLLVRKSGVCTPEMTQIPTALIQMPGIPAFLALFFFQKHIAKNITYPS